MTFIKAKSVIEEQQQSERALASTPIDDRLESDYHRVGFADTCAIEEAANVIRALSELIHLATKAERFGPRNFDPLDRDRRINAERIVNQMTAYRLAAKKLVPRLVRLREECQQQIAQDRLIKSQNTKPR